MSLPILILLDPPVEGHFPKICSGVGCKEGNKNETVNVSLFMTGKMTAIIVEREGRNLSNEQTANGTKR
jgi:hypothetical protein